ncbi:flagellar assembly protein FliW [Anaerovorax odorimutans]|uniref:flagellar assembly protein FliW n=1 Tax=Anaerovorax odorimutans TaxID=109327 RepID=UPI0003F630D2|nr:flagellar assembly protein FliW [Anaerovorax odorimutans]
MNIDTKYFGNIEIDEDEKLIFPNGLFGFENNKSFFILAFDDSDKDILCLQSADEPYLAFVIINPYSIVSTYEPVLSKYDLKDLKADNNISLIYYSLAVVHDEFKNTTINLKCPIVLNVEKKLAKQVILEDSTYSLRHPIMTPNKEE